MRRRAERNRMAAGGWTAAVALVVTLVAGCGPSAERQAELDALREGVVPDVGAAMAQRDEIEAAYARARAGDEADVGYGVMPGGGTPVEHNGRVWRFRGRVIDLLRNRTVPDARLTFSNAFLQGVGTYTAMTNASGAYSVEVPSLGDNAYNVRVDHPAVHAGQIWPAEVMRESSEERLLLGVNQGIQFHGVSGTYRGTDNFTETLDLYVFPTDLTETERRQQSDALRRRSGTP